MSEHNKICGIREDKRTGQFVPQVDGKDISPTSFDPERAQSIAWQAANMPPDVAQLRAQRDRLRECLEGLLDAMQTPAHKAEGVMRLPSQSRIDRARAALKECEQ